MSSRNQLQHSAYSAPAPRTQQPARRVHSPQELQHAAPQPTKDLLRRAIRRVKDGLHPPRPRNWRSVPPPARAEAELVPAPHGPHQGSVQEAYAVAVDVDVDPEIVPHLRTEPARTSPELAAYNRAYVMIDGVFWKPLGSISEYEACELEESISSSYSPVSEFDCSESSFFEEDADEYEVLALIASLPSGPLPLTAANLCLKTYLHARVPYTPTPAPALTKDQIRHINKYGNQVHDEVVFDTTLYRDHRDVIPIERRPFLPPGEHRDRCGSMDSMAPMDPDLLDNDVTARLLQYVKREYTNTGHFRQIARELWHGRE